MSACWEFYKAATGGHDIYCDGKWVGWSAGSLADAKQMAREMGATR